MRQDSRRTASASAPARSAGVVSRPRYGADTAQLGEIAPQVAAAARAVGMNGFYEALLRVYRCLAPHNLVTVVRYNRFSKPNFLFHHDYSDELAAAYLDRFYELDPFHHYWRDYERPGVIALHEFTSSELKRSRYIWEFLQKSRIDDELGIFLPPVARSSVAMFLERAEGTFHRSETDRVRRFYPILAGLHDAHVNCTFGSLGSNDIGPGLNLNVPTAIVDASGDMVFANEGWRSLDSVDPEVRRAMAALDDIGESDILISGGRVLHRETLAPEFCLAPGGWFYRIETTEAEPRLDPPRRVFERMYAQLSPRELDIIELVLHGHSTDAIAECLGLTRGTVKNYRRRIYSKLEISTERELFLAYIEALSGDTMDALKAVPSLPG